MANKKITIEYDINKKPIDVAIDSTLNLKQVVKELTKELNKTGRTQEEIQLLSKRLNEAKDNVAKIDAKSRELFGTMSLLPGPVGDFSNQLDNSIGLLKTFSNFKLSDITNQLKELGNDMLDIAKNILGLNVAQKELAIAEAEATAGAVAETVAIETETVATEAATVATITFGQALKAIGIGLALAGLAALVIYWDDIKDAISGVTEETKKYDEVSKKAIDKEGEQIVKLELLTKQVKSGTLTQREKNEAVNDYNKTLGDTLGKVKSYSELEAKLIKDGPDYISYLKSKALAEAAYQLAVEKGKDVLKKGVETGAQNIGFFDKIIGYSFGLSQESQNRVGEKIRDGQKKVLQDQQQGFLDIFDVAEKETNRLANKLGLKVPDVTYTGDTKSNVKEDPRVQQKKDTIKAIEDLEKKSFIDSLSEREKELYQTNQTYSELLFDATRFGLDTTLLTEQNGKDKLAINKKYDDLEKKRQEDASKFIQDWDLKIQQDANAAIEKTNKDKLDRESKQLDDELRLLELKGQTLTQGTHAYYENQRAMIEKAMEKEIQLVKKRAEEEKWTEQKLQDELTAIRAGAKQAKEKSLEDEVKSYINFGGQVASAIGDIYGAQADALNEEAKTSKEAFDKRKQFQLQSARMGAASAIMSILASTGTGNFIIDAILKGLQIGATVIKTNTQIDNIKNTQFEGGGNAPLNTKVNYGDGGMINGPLHANGGVAITAEGGEAVMTRGAVTMFNPLLSMMNQMGGGTSFSKGATGQASFDNPKTTQVMTQPQIIKTYVVSSEMTTDQHRQERLKDLSTL